MGFKKDYEVAEQQNKVYFKKQAEMKNENKDLKAELEAESTRLKTQIKKNNAKFQKTCEELFKKRLKADEEKREYHNQLQICNEELEKYKKKLREYYAKVHGHEPTEKEVFEAILKEKQAKANEKYRKTRRQKKEAELKLQESEGKQIEESETIQNLMKAFGTEEETRKEQETISKDEMVLEETQSEEKENQPPNRPRTRSRSRKNSQSEEPKSQRVTRSRSRQNSNGSQKVERSQVPDEPECKTQ